jgi:hypothetical protein
MDKTSGRILPVAARILGAVAVPETTEHAESRTPAEPDGREHAGRDFALYSLARLGLIVVIAGVLVALGVPLVLGIGIGVIAGYPISLLAFRRLGARASASMNQRRQRRSAERERLRAELRGDR